MKMLELNSQDLQQVKDVVNSNLNKIISIKQINKQGKILKIYKGKIASVYNNLFLMEIDNNGYLLNKTFTYTDLITGEFVLEI